ncbi:MAG: TonB family protein [Campylobacterota bacterium]
MDFKTWEYYQVKNRYVISFFISLMIYTTAIASMLYTEVSEENISEKETNKKQTVQKINMQEYVQAPQKPTIQKPQIKTPQIQQPSKPKPPKVEKPKPQPKPKKQPPKPKQKPQKPIEVKKPIPSKPQEVPKPKEPQPQESSQKPIKKQSQKVTQPKHDPQTVAMLQSSLASLDQAKKAVAAQKKELFLAHLKKQIEANKRYPKVAQRRGLEATVATSFIITKEGGVKDITADTSHKIFHKSSVAAIQKAFPLQIQYEGVALPMQVSLTLAYKLR